MVNDLSSRTPDGVAIVVADGLAARQWEAHLADDRIGRGEIAWVSPSIAGYRNWAAQSWLAGGQGRPVPLTPLQSQALWRRIVADSKEGAALIGSDGAGEWAAEAWDLLCNWQLDPAKLRASEQQSDFRAFLNWCRRYGEWLGDAGWVDHAQIDALLPTAELQAPRRLILADLENLSPAREALLSRFEGSGCRIERWTAPNVSGTRYRVGLPDGTAELYAAARWAWQRLADRPTTRVALVVPDLRQRYVDIERALANTISPELIWHSAERLASTPLIGAALNAIELISPRATFATFSRWLRSPLVEGADSAQRSGRATLEQCLRGELASQLGFAQAYREAGLAELIRRDAPEVADAVDHAFKEIGTTRTATPSRWAKLWQRALTQLGWPAAGHRTDDPALLAWQAAIDDFAQLTPILGAVPGNRALHELERILQQRRPTAALPLAGVHVFAHIDEVGPGYEAAWVTGFTDAQWPQTAQSNPLLPRHLQREHRMPWCSPQDARDRSAISFGRLLDRVADLTISWPARMYDYPTEPSPAIRSLPELAPEHVDSIVAARRVPRHAQRARETVDDKPPGLAGDVITGGVSALNRQARCPLRAFCEFRLAARVLEPVSRGLSPRFQGIAAHRALELLLQALPAQADLAHVENATIDRCVEQALVEGFLDARRPLSVLFELERQRLSSLIVELLHSDSQRAAFQVDAVEQRQTIRIGEWTLRVRIDRRDRLADGGIAVIDYKTGANVNSTDWFKERLRDTQVPIYAVHAVASVEAAVIAQLHSGQTGYTGFWLASGSFPGNARRLPYARSWAEQLATWRAQIQQLIDEFTAGDTRLLMAESDLDEARGAYSPLSRVTEQSALQRGSLAPW